jgi:hypothetical protein
MLLRVMDKRTWKKQNTEEESGKNCSLEWHNLLS